MAFKYGSSGVYDVVNDLNKRSSKVLIFLLIFGYYCSFCFDLWGDSSGCGNWSGDNWFLSGFWCGSGGGDWGSSFLSSCVWNLGSWRSLMGNWILWLVWSVVKIFTCKSSLNFSNLSLSIIRRNWHIFFLSDGSSDGSNWSFFGGFSFRGYGCWFNNRKYFWNISSWSLGFVKRSWSLNWFFSFYYWLCWSWSLNWFFSFNYCLCWFWSLNFFFSFNYWFCWFWIGFLLVISTWTWCPVWIVDVFEIILVCSVFKVKWLLELLDTIILIVNFLWNKTVWSIWVDLLLNKSSSHSWVWSSLRSSSLGRGGIFGVSFPFVGRLSNNSWGVVSVDKIWFS